MHYTEIKKTDVSAKAVNMSDYDTTYANFSWKNARKLIDGLPEGGFNIAHEAIERHVNAGHGDQIALRWIAKNGDRTDFTYQELSKLSNRFANVLRSRGLEKGARVYSLLGRTPELYIAALGTLKAGCVFCPLFSAFGPEPIHSRMEIGGGQRFGYKLPSVQPQDQGAARHPARTEHCVTYRWRH